MTGETQDSTGPDREPRQQRQRRPATIDLTATEAAESVPPSEQPEQNSAGDADKTAADEPSIAVVSEEDKSRRPWPAFVGAAAGAATAFAVFGALWAGGFLIRGDRDGAALAALQQEVRELASRSTPPAQDPRLDQVTARIDAVEKRTRAVEEQLSRMGQNAVTGPDAGVALGQRLTALEAASKAIGGEVSDLRQRIEAAFTMIREARSAADAALAARQGSKEMGGEPPPEKAPAFASQQDIAALQNRLGSLEGGINALKAELGAIKTATSTAILSDAAARRALLAQSLRAAAAAGQPFAAELAGLKGLGADDAALAALEPFAARGLPSAADLRREFDPVGRAILAAADLAPGDRHSGMLERLQASAERLVRVRPVAEGPGQDAPAVVARIHAQLGRGDVAAAVGEVNALPPALRDPAAAWLKHAQAHLDGLEAARRLAGEALRALAKDRS